MVECRLSDRLPILQATPFLIWIENQLFAWKNGKVLEDLENLKSFGTPCRHLANFYSRLAWTLTEQWR